MAIQVAIAGGGIGGLAAAVACRRAGCHVHLFEQAAEFAEVGAGIQLGPNATRMVDSWGLGAALREVAAAPGSLAVRGAIDDAQVAAMQLGASFIERYGAPYLTVHRADMHALLLRAAREAGAKLELNVHVSGTVPEADALVAADGVWSALRSQVIDDGPPRATGHLAYRSLVSQSLLPAHLRRDGITVWLAPRMHIVAYPVRGGEQLNVVAIVEAASRGPAHDWDQGGAAAELLAAMGPVCAPLCELVDAMPAWRLWALHDRAPLEGPQAMARGRVALLGDAAHPMLPYLAQGAAMAIEDAAELGNVLARASPDAVPQALQRYANARWRRCAQVQAHARRNARIFHAGGLVRWGRDVSLRLLGERLLDQPWLYAR
jgi:salicylate hydroxylase